jgi:hypothetical protein
MKEKLQDPSLQPIAARWAAPAEHFVRRHKEPLLMPQEHPGIAFEKMVAAIQSQIDPAAVVSHNEVLVDRLGHSRQFDVVIRGSFAGQAMLGIIECKDLKRRVSNPEVDAFVTKAQDINANFKILMSRAGFTKPALAKCEHYGVQALSMLEDDPANRRFFIGTRWTADLTRWGQISVTLQFAEPPPTPISFRAEDLKISNKKILDWFTNYLLDHEFEIEGLGWVVELAVVFDVPQTVEIRPGEHYLCVAIGFNAERVCEKRERLVGISGTGFFNWNSQQVTFPPGATIATDGVPTDFNQWSPRSDGVRKPSGFLEFHLEARAVAFARVADAIELDKL